MIKVDLGTVEIRGMSSMVASEFMLMLVSVLPIARKYECLHEDIKTLVKEGLDTKKNLSVEDLKKISLGDKPQKVSKMIEEIVDDLLAALEDEDKPKTEAKKESKDDYLDLDKIKAIIEKEYDVDFDKFQEKNTPYILRDLFKNRPANDEETLDIYRAILDAKGYKKKK